MAYTSTHKSMRSRSIIHRSIMLHSIKKVNITLMIIIVRSINILNKIKLLKSRILTKTNMCQPLNLKEDLQSMRRKKRKILVVMKKHKSQSNNMNLLLRIKSKIRRGMTKMLKWEMDKRIVKMMIIFLSQRLLKMMKIALSSRRV